MALHLPGRSVRVDCILPTNCNATLRNELIGNMHRPDLKAPAREACEPVFQQFQAMPIPYVQTADIANLAVFLAGDESRCITGQQIRLDVGLMLKIRSGAAMTS